MLASTPRAGEHAMSTIEILDADGHPITDWRGWVRPKEPVKHWKPGRSAMECARAWFTSPVPVVPAEIRNLLDSHEKTRGLHLVSGRPERVTSLPGSTREGRNHDLALVGGGGTEMVTVCIEAKADESFGNTTVGSYFKQKQGTTSGVPARIDALLDLLVGRGTNPTSAPWGDIRYQLLTATAGTLLQAIEDGSSIAVFVVHEFHTTETRDANIRRNAADFAALVQALSNVPANDVRDGVLYGPHRAGNVDLLVGKAVYAWGP